MRCHLGAAKFGHQQGDQTESARLGKISYPNGQAQLEQASHQRPMRPLKSGQWPGRAIDRAAAHPPQQHQQVEPHAHQGRPGAAQAAEPGKPQPAKDQQPVHQNIEQQGDQRCHHERFGLVQAGAVAVQNAVAGKGGQGETADAHEVARQVAHLGFKGQIVKHQAGQIGQHHGDQAHTQGLPKCLAHQMRNRAELPGADVMRHHRTDRHHHTHDRDDDHVPDRYAQRYPREILRRGMPGHGNLCHRHTDVGELTNQQRPGQHPQGAGLKACAGGGELSKRRERWHGPGLRLRA